MKKILLAFLVLTAGLVLLGCVQNNATPAAPVATDVRIGVPTATPPASPIATNITIAVPSALEINVTVDAPARNYFKTRIVEAQEGETAFAVFSKALEMEWKNYSFGALVTGVEGINQSDAEGLYWQYYFNGVLAPVGVSDFKVSENGVLEWRLEKPNFGAFENAPSNAANAS